MKLSSPFCVMALLLILSGLLAVPLSSAQKQYDNFTLTVTSNNATTCNLSSITYPDNSNIIYNIEMTQNGREFYTTIDGGNYTQIGEICHNVICFDGIQYEDGSVCEHISVTGNDKMNSGEGLSLLGSVFVMVLIGFVFLILGLKIEHKASKIVLIGFSGMIFFTAVLFCVAILQQNLGGFTTLVEDYAAFFTVLKMIVTILVVFFLFISIIFAWNSWQQYRGFKD